MLKTYKHYNLNSFSQNIQNKKVFKVERNKQTSYGKEGYDFILNIKKKFKLDKNSVYLT